MPNTYLTADYHFGEDRMELMGRPFSSSAEMIDYIINQHNAIVKPEDEVIVVGDVCYQKKPDMIPYVSRMNGNKTLIRGNHDRVIDNSTFCQFFKTIIDEGDGIVMAVKDVPIPCYITHYPSEGKEDMFNLVGHIHAAWKYQLNMFNVGVDVNHFRPVNIDKIPFHFNAICKFYDEDVWVSYNKINASYQHSRGKLGTYFRPYEKTTTK